MTAEEPSESLDIDDIIESESQNNSQQLQIELCLLNSKMQTLELENKTVKEENESQKEKIKIFTDYFESIQDDEDNAEKLKEELKEKECELEKMSELIAEEVMNAENAQREYELEISKLNGEIVSLETENEQTKIELTKTKETCQLSYETYFNDIATLREEKEAQELFFNKEYEKMKNENKQLKDKIDQLQTKHDELIEANTMSMTELIEKYTNDIKSLQQTQQNASKNFNEVKELKAIIFKIEHEKELLKAEIGSKQSLLNDQLKLNKELNENINKLNGENMGLEGKIDEMKSKMLNDIGVIADPFNNKLNNNSNGTITDIQKQLEEAQNELLKYKALDNAIKMNNSHTLKYKSDIKQLQNELIESKNKYNGLLKQQKQNENSQQTQQIKIDPKRLTVKPIDDKKIRMNDANQGTNILFNSIRTPKKGSIDLTYPLPVNEAKLNNNNNINNQDHIMQYKKTISLNNTSQEFYTNSSELQKQILFLTEQNKSYQKDIAMSIKNKEEILSKINVLQEKNSHLETQLITRNREINKYKILVNRLKLKEKE